MNTTVGNNRKLTEKGKVELLENIVLSGDVEKVNAVIEECQTFEFTARALGLACLYASLDVVKALIKAGATFYYPTYGNTIKKYRAAYPVLGGKKHYPVNYSVMLAENIPNDGDYGPAHRFYFGLLPKVNVVGNNSETLADIAEYLLHEDRAAFDAPQTLFYAVLWGNIEVAERLKEKGTSITIESSTRSRQEIMSTLTRLPADKCLYALKELSWSLQASKQKLSLPKSVFESPKSSVFDPEVLRFVLSETDISKLNKTAIVKQVIDIGNVEGLEVLASADFIKSKKQREAAVSYATEQGKNDMIAWMLDYQNRTVDIVAEEEKELKKMFRELNAAPDSVTVLKKKWSYVKLKDGTLEITSYKGDEEEVEIPPKIGRDAVTSIGDDAFSASWSSTKKNKENKMRIIAITIPDTVVRIGDRAFEECGALKTIVLPESVREIGLGAFHGCRALAAIRLPDGIKSIELSTFCNCYSLKDIVIPQSVRQIGAYAFENCRSLEAITLPDAMEFTDIRQLFGRTDLKKYYHRGQWHNIQ